ncbi:MAG: 16S rRNA (uracil(1498)-N(3))-methyltransferase [Candidatus Omnitrophica bacterium]|nr:16S rRNA (uracil(1498)-N(3))-methyltransferase [Candidatus Omnitrophota bacterium]
MSRFYVPKENIKDNKIFIEGQEAKHVASVMRLCQGDKVVVFDGTGKEYTGFILDINKKRVTVEIVETKISSKVPVSNITLVQSILKKEKMDYIIEKATELGVKEIIPVITDRTVVVYDEPKKIFRQQRWEKIALSSAKQCGRVDVPKIGDVVPFAEVIEHIKEYDTCLFAWLSKDTEPLKNAIEQIRTGNVIVFIGPEGDFTQNEVDMTKQHANVKYVSLGDRVLKGDTAGLYVLSCLNYELF